MDRYSVERLRPSQPAVPPSFTARTAPPRKHSGYKERRDGNHPAVLCTRLSRNHATIPWHNSCLTYNLVNNKRLWAIGIAQ